MPNFRRINPAWAVLTVLLILSGAISFLPASIIQAIIPQAVPTANKRGTSTIFALAGSTTPGSAGATVCDDGSGNYGTTGCSGGGSSNVITSFQVRTASGTNVLPAFASNVTAGDLLVAFGYRNSSLANPCVATDTQGNTYTQAEYGTNNNGSPNQLAVSTAKAGSTGADTITLCASALDGAVGVDITPAATLGTGVDSGSGTTAAFVHTVSQPLPWSLTQDKDITLTAGYGTTCTFNSSTGPEILIANPAFSGKCEPVTLLALPAGTTTGSFQSSLVITSAGNNAYVSLGFKSH